MAAGFMFAGCQTTAAKSTHDCSCNPCACAGKCSCIGGRWAFSFGGRAGWMGVVRTGDAYSASILWGGGSPIAQESATFADGTLTLRQKHGKGSRVTLARADGDKVRLTVRTLDAAGKLVAEQTAEGWRIPELLVPGENLPAWDGLRAEEGLYLCSDLPFPDGCIWNLSFD